MASTLRTGLALAALTAGGSALGLSPFDPHNGRMSPYGSQDVCGPRFVSFEHLDEDHPRACIVYCVPKGPCVAKARNGRVHDKLELAAEGNCKRRGFGEYMALGNITGRLAESLENIKGVCKGMKLLRFRRKGGEADSKLTPPERIVHSPPPGEDAEDDAPIVDDAPTGDDAPTEAPPTPMPTPTKRQGCQPDFVAFKAMRRLHVGSACSVFCVPEGRCQNLVLTGKMRNLNISGEGTCAGTEYTEPAEMDVATYQLSYWLKTLSGPCKGMTMATYQPPGAPKKAAVDSDGRVCGIDTMAYEAHNPLQPNSCGVYCVPKGKCEGLVQSGSLKLGITQQGNCRGRGFTKPAAAYGRTGEAAFAMAQSFKGACKGMTYAKYEKPLPA